MLAKLFLCFLVVVVSCGCSVFMPDYSQYLTTTTVAPSYAYIVAPWHGNTITYNGCIFYTKDYANGIIDVLLYENNGIWYIKGNTTKVIQWLDASGEMHQQ